jgi:hypothetical protein
VAEEYREAVGREDAEENSAVRESRPRVGLRPIVALGGTRHRGAVHLAQQEESSGAEGRTQQLGRAGLGEVARVPGPEAVEESRNRGQEG